jgi:N-acetylneuraminate synthase
MLSADPEEMKWLVEAVRNFEIMRGSGIKGPAESEKITRRNNRKSVVLNRSVKAGERLTEQDIAVKRPGYGIGPKYFEQIVGRTVLADLEKDTVLTWNDLA